MTSVLPAGILLATDGSEDAATAGRAAADLAARTGAELHLVHAWHEPTLPMQLPEYEQDLHDRLVEDSRRLGEKALRERAGELAELLGTRPETRVVTGDATVAILEAAADEPSTLVAVGSRGLGTARRVVLGSVSTKLLRATRGPILVQHPRSDG